MAIERLGFYDASEVKDFLTPGGAADLSSSFEAAVAAGTTAQYWRGDKTWQNLTFAVLGSKPTTLVGYGITDALASSALDTDGTLAANSDAKIASQKATKTYVDATVTGVMKLKGVTDCSANPNYPAAAKGDAYIVTVAGKIGGASGKSVDVGDVYLASAANAGGTEASVGTSWNVLEHNLIGALLSANNLSDVASASTARTNLGLAIGTNVQAWDADLDAVAASGVAAAWTAFTPASLSSGTGALTTATATGRYKQIGKTVFVQINVTITTNGTAGAAIRVALPVTASTAGDYFLSGEEFVGGKALTGRIAPALSGLLVYITAYDNTYPGGSGSTLAVSGTYEAA